MKRLHTLRTHFALIFALTIASAGCLIAQMPGINSPLPDAPTAPPILFAQQTSAPMTQIAAQAPSTGPDSAAAGENPRLALSDAEKLAIKNNPRVSVARLLALAQHQPNCSCVKSSVRPFAISPTICTPGLSRPFSQDFRPTELLLGK